MAFFQVLHEHGNNHVHEDKLGHKDEDDEENGRDDRAYATISHTICCIITVISQGVLHNAVPVVAGRHSEQCQERHSEVGKVGVLSEALTGQFVGALKAPEQLNTQSGKYEEQEEEKETQISHLETSWGREENEREWLSR